VAGEHRNFDNGVDRREVRDYQNWRYPNQVSGGNEPGNLRVDDAEGELADDVEHTCGNHLIEGILNERFEPTPEEPVELRNNEEWNKHRSQKNTKRRGHHAEGHNEAANLSNQIGQANAQRIADDTQYVLSNLEAPGITQPIATFLYSLLWLGAVVTEALALIIVYVP